MTKKNKIVKYTTYCIFGGINLTDEDFIIERCILRIGNKINNGRDKDLAKIDLTPNQSETLLFFGTNKGNTIIDLKNHLRITHQAARNTVERMKKKNLLYVVISKEDARFKHIYLTEKGKKLFYTLKAMGTTVGQQLLQGLSPEEKNILHSLLIKIDDNI